MECEYGEWCKNAYNVSIMNKVRLLYLSKNINTDIKKAVITSKNHVLKILKKSKSTKKCT